MSTTDQAEVVRLARSVEAKGAMALDCRCPAVAIGPPPATFRFLPVVIVKRLNVSFLF